MSQRTILRYVAGTSITLAAGVIILTAGVAALPAGIAAAVKLSGRAPDCPWQRVFQLESNAVRFDELQKRMQAGIQVIETDPKLPIQKLRAGKREFWVREHGTWNGERLLAYLLAEHEWDAENMPDMTARPGDTVIDCGGHIGVYTAKALALGAKLVVGIEPDPINAECYRRNFAKEIAGGTVKLIEKGAWSSSSSIDLMVGERNSGMSSMVNRNGERKVTVPVEPIDKMVAELGLTKVDLIKMDIEGAEREALKGAQETLRKWRPRLMLDANHRPDDLVVLPKVIRSARAEYTLECGACEMDRNAWEIKPHVIYFR